MLVRIIQLWRHGIKNRKEQFKMASSVITSITSSVKAR